jgi:hypothetical protein
MNDLQQSAIEYAKRGLRIIPLRPRTKIPLLVNWVNQASSDTKIITNWWTDYPDANIGCVTGKESGIFVLDVDCHEGKADGRDTLRELELTHGQLPDTVEQITGGGGRQMFFRYPPAGEIKNKTGSGAIAPGLEIKGDGGQVVLPPSIHPDTGREYVWEASSSICDVEIVEAPEWLINLITATPAKTKRGQKFERRATDGPASEIFSKCMFIQHCRDNAADLSEPLWLAMISNVARCADGPKIVHELSSPYPKYTYEETNAKIIHSLDDMHPQSCEYIRSIGFTGCPAGGCGVRNPASFALSPKLWKKQETPFTASGGIETYTAADLDDMDLPEPTWIVPGIVTTGLTFLCGKPKVGKSWLALSLALSVAYGGYAMGKIQVERRPTLYLGLEDTYRRLKSRLKMLCGNVKPPKELILARSIPRADEGGLQAIVDIVKQTGARLVVIDTFQLFRRGSNKSDNAYQADYQAAAEIKAIADAHEIGIILVHHLKKAVEGDFVQSVSGSSGITGAADTIIILDRARLTGDAVLKITGRDVDETELALKKDPQTNGWNLIGTAEDVRRSVERQEIIMVLRQNPEGMTPSQVGEEVNKKRGVVQKLMGQMVDSGEIRRVARGCYAVASKEEPF